MQIGSAQTSLSQLKTNIHRIVSDPYDSAVIIPGDIEDEDRPSTRAIRAAAFAGREEVISRDAEKHMAYIDKEIVPLLMRLQQTKYGILGILAGHHWTQLTPVLNSAQYICNELSRLSKKKVPYLGVMTAYLDLRFFRHDKPIMGLLGHIQHGEGGGQTKAATLAKLERTAQGFDGDFYIRGHDCQLLATKTYKLSPKRLRDKESQPEMLSRTIPYINLGAFTKAYDMGRGAPSYVEQSMMRPATLGCACLKIKIRKSHPWENRDRNLAHEMFVEI